MDRYEPPDSVSSSAFFDEQSVRVKKTGIVGVVDSVRQSSYGDTISVRFEHYGANRGNAMTFPFTPDELEAT